MQTLSSSYDNVVIVRLNSGPFKWPVGGLQMKYISMKGEGLNLSYGYEMKFTYFLAYPFLIL